MGLSLDPAEVRNMINDMVAAMATYNTQLRQALSPINAFINEPDLEGESYRNLKSHMQDHITILHGIIVANDSFAENANMLLSKIGTERLIEDELVNTIQTYKGMIEQYEEMKDYYERMNRNEIYASAIGPYATSRIILYNNIIENARNIISIAQEKIDTLYDVDADIQSLFEETASMYDDIMAGIKDMQSCWDGTGFVPSVNARWRTILVDAWKGSQLKLWEIAENELGLTKEEIQHLRNKDIRLTSNDIALLKKTLTTNQVFVSSDKKSLFYSGGIYPIYVPSGEIAFEAAWKTDEIKKVSSVDFKIKADNFGINLEEIPKEPLYTKSGQQISSGTLSSKDKNVKEAAVLHAIMGLGSFILSSLSKSEVSVLFQSADANKKRVIITTGNSEDRLYFENFNYALGIDSYRDSLDFPAERLSSNYAAGMYKMITGEEVPDPDGLYTMSGTLDERHKDTNISGYLSYSAHGKLMYTPMVYSGDRAYIESVDGIFCLGRTKILDFTDKLSTPAYADARCQQLFEEVLKGKED